MDEHNPKISIIVPVYNTEKYISKCIESILDQTFTDFELILVDDGSKDRSGTICDEYSDKDSRIIVIHKENGGVSSARNQGIRESKCKYIMFCDSDDYVDSHWCELLFCSIKKFPNNWIVSNMWKETSKNKFNKMVDDLYLNVAKLTYFDIYKMGISAYTVDKIYSRDIIVSHSIYFNEKCSFGEDVKFNIDYFKYCTGITFIETPTYYYCNNEAGLMNSQTNKWMERHLPLFYERINVIEKDDLCKYCDIWLYLFIEMFDYVYFETNKSYLKKLNYNQKMLKSKEFQFCLEHASGKNESKIVLKLLKMKNYYIFYAFQKIMQFKSKLRGR